MAKHKQATPPSHHRRKFWVVALVAVTAGMTTGVSWNHVNEQRQAHELAQMHQRVDAETESRLADEAFFAHNRQQVQQAVAAELRQDSQKRLDEAVAQAQQLLTQTQDQVLDATVLVNLKSTVDAIALTPPGSPGAMNDATDTLSTQTEQVRISHEAWGQEQARLAAEAEAARIAAEEKAAQERAAEEAAKKEPPRKKAVETPVAPSEAEQPVPQQPSQPQGRTYTKNVWAYGHQGEIDACKGAVLSDYGADGISIGEHNHCGGKYVLSLKVGDTVTLSGVISGTYQVVGSQDVSKNSSSAVLGGSMWLQTCYFNSSTMRLVQIVPM